MKKYLIVIICLINSGALFSSDTLHLFNIQGECFVISNNTKSKCGINDILTADAVLEIISGEVVLVNSSLSRLTINKPGTYEQNYLQSQFSDGEQGKESKFMGYLADLIQKEKIEITSPGGVVRGEKELKQPLDSAVILGTRIPIKLYGDIDAQYEIWNTEKAEMVSKGNFRQNINILQTSSDWWSPGTYMLNILIQPGTRISRFIFIPGTEEREHIMDEYHWFFDAFSEIESKEQRDLVLMEMAQLNKIYLLY